jgi:hypothetical protein
MPLQLATRHNEAFDIYSPFIDPGLSTYAKSHGSEYVRKVLALYEEIKIDSALWTTPVSQLHPFYMPDKPLEYRLVVDDCRAVAWIDEAKWSAYIRGTLKSFSAYSRTATWFEYMSVLVPAPLLPGEAKEVRLLRMTQLGHCEVVSRKRLD